MRASDMGLFLRICAGVLIFTGATAFATLALIIAVALSVGLPTNADAVPKGLQLYSALVSSGILSGVGGILWAVLRITDQAASKSEPRRCSHADNLR
jgi:hypothetical protein